jgi:hypothetical protein
MAVLVNNISVSAAGGGARTGEELTAYAELANDGGDTAEVQVDFLVDGQHRGTAGGHITAGGSQWFSVGIGQLSAGGHEIEANAAVEADQQSTQVTNGMSFTVEGAAAPEQPNVTVGELQLQAHSNVEHGHNQAWEGERIRASVQLTNRGGHRIDAAVWLSDGAGHDANLTAAIEPGASEWVSHDFDALAAGQHTFQAHASTETDTQSVVLGSSQATLTVTAASSNFRRVNFQLGVNNFRGRPMAGRMIFVQFLGTDGSVADGAETVSGAVPTAGILTQPNISIPSRGQVRVMAVSTGGADEPIESNHPYHLADGQTELGLTANQRSDTATYHARSLQGVRDQLSASGHAGIEIEVLSIGGEVGTEHEESREFETSVDWNVRYGLGAFDFVDGT